MQKNILISVLSTLLFFSACTEKKEETQAPIKQEPTSKEITTKETNVIIEKKVITDIQKPFTPTVELNVSKENVVTESLEELEAEAFKTIQPQIIEEMQKIPDCLENAESSKEAFDCSNNLRALNKELSMAMGDFTEEEIENYEDDFVWNEETKVNMIKEIEAGTQAMQEMQTCMETSKSPEELAKCLEL